MSRKQSTPTNNRERDLSSYCYECQQPQSSELKPFIKDDRSMVWLCDHCLVIQHKQQKKRAYEEMDELEYKYKVARTIDNLIEEMNESRALVATTLARSRELRRSLYYMVNRNEPNRAFDPEVSMEASCTVAL